MHGIIFSELRKFVGTTLGPRAWDEVTRRAGVSGTYSATSTYPDEQAADLFAALAELARRPAPEVLEEFGEYMATDLLEVYRPLIDPEWKTLDLIEHTEETIHTVVRMRNPGAAPPKLHCTRPTPNEVVLVYRSPRRLCALARGLARGIATHYGERILVREDTCMLRGAVECRISIRRV